MRHLAPAPLGAVASLSARTAVRGAKVFRAGAKARGAPLVLRRSPSTVAAATVVPSEVLGNAVPLNNDAAHVTCGASPLSPARLWGPSAGQLGGHLVCWEPRDAPHADGVCPHTRTWCRASRLLLTAWSGALR